MAPYTWLLLIFLSTFRLLSEISALAAPFRLAFALDCEEVSVAVCYVVVEVWFIPFLVNTWFKYGLLEALLITLRPFLTFPPTRIVPFLPPLPACSPLGLCD